MEKNIAKIMIIMMLILFSSFAKATTIFVRNFTNQSVNYYALCPLNKIGPYTCNKKVLAPNELFKYTAEGLCGPCAMKVGIYKEDGKTKLCDTGDAVYSKLMMVSIRQNGDAFSCEKSVDPTDSEKLFP